MSDFIKLPVIGSKTSRNGNWMLLVRHPQYDGGFTHVVVKNQTLALAASEVLVGTDVEILPPQTRQDGTQSKPFATAMFLGIAGNRASRLEEEARVRANAAEKLAELGL